MPITGGSKDPPDPPDVKPLFPILLLYSSISARTKLNFLTIPDFYGRLKLAKKRLFLPIGTIFHL